MFSLLFVPESKSPQECVGIVAGTAAGRQSFYFLDVAAAQNHFSGFERRFQSFHHIGNVALPFPLPVFLESVTTDIVLVRPVPIRQMANFHRLDDAVVNQRAAEPCSEPQKQHRSFAIAAERLHRRVVDDLDGTIESALEVKSDPSFARLRGSDTGRPRSTGPG